MHRDCFRTRKDGERQRTISFPRKDEDYGPGPERNLQVSRSRDGIKLKKFIIESRKKSRKE